VLEKNGQRAFGHGAVADKQDFFVEFDHGAGRWRSGEQLGRLTRVSDWSACKLNHELCGKGRWLTSSFRGNVLRFREHSTFNIQHSTPKESLLLGR
jgi:hypothetical protein